MRIRESGAAVVLLLATLCLPAAAQRTRDRPTLIFTVSGAYIDGAQIWTVVDQPVPDVSEPLLVDHFSLSRSVRSTFGAGFSGTYYRGQHFGLSAEAFLLGLGYYDTCRINLPVQSAANAQLCTSLDKVERSGAAVATTVGAVYRIASDEFISPFARMSVGFLINNESPLLVIGEASSPQGQAELVIYNDYNRSTRLRPALGLGVGTTIAVGKGYQLRWEIRDNIIGIQRVTGPTGGPGLVPPHETVYKSLLSLNIGFDVILERHRGRRY